jgi:hypothetical protein
VRLKLSPAVFSISYCCGYALIYKWNLPLFRYYPVPHQWARGATDLIARPGPSMVWYGLVASATLIATTPTLIVGVAATLLDKKWRMPSFRGWLWVAPWLVAAFCVYLLRVFFR